MPHPGGMRTVYHRPVKYVILILITAAYPVRRNSLNRKGKWFALNSLIYGVVIVALAAMMVYALRRQERRRREAPGPAGMSEYRTDLPIDECMDRLRAHSEADAFQYTCERQPDGGYLLHLTLHQPTRQPLDTLYTLRMEQGRQTVVTLMFVREAFGYGEPVFRQDVMDGFMADKLEAKRTV